MTILDIQIDLFSILILMGTIVGIFYSYKEYGRTQYNAGISDAICMHYTGSLVYEIIVDENGDEDIEIKINGG